MRFKNRIEAGKQLAKLLAKYKDKEGVVFALPRGGVPLGVEIARALNMPLDLVIPRKIGHPYNPEYAIAAVSESGELAGNEQEISVVDPVWFKQAVELERQEARRRREQYLGGQPRLSADGKIAIIVDDGIATGLTMQAAIHDILLHNPALIIVAIPVSPRETAARLRDSVDDVVAVDIPDFYLGAVGAYYDEFPQVSDEEVMTLLGERRTN